MISAVGRRRRLLPWVSVAIGVALAGLIGSLGVMAATGFFDKPWTAHCPTSPLDGVHDPDRLIIKTGCQYVEGVVVDVPSRHEEGDRDFRYLVDLTASFDQLGDRGRIWLEVVPRHEFTVRARPVAGDRVQAVGTHVWDTAHAWSEIHPCTWLKVVD